MLIVACRQTYVVSNTPVFNENIQGQSIPRFMNALFDLREQILVAYTFAYAWDCSACKASILFFYRRVFVISHHELLLRVYLLVGFFLTLPYPMIVWITMRISCKPLSRFWNQFSGGSRRCIETNTFFPAAGIINMANDVVVILVPFPQIAKLQMNHRKKIDIYAIPACIIQGTSS